MTIIFKSMRIQNFLSFKDAEIEFPDKGFVQIIGDNENIADSAKSNGSGKSSIFEALCWAITGETIRGVKKVRNIYSVEGALVELNLTIDNVDYTIMRSQEHSKYKNNLLLFKDKEEISGKGIRDSEKILKDLFPDLTIALLGSVMVLGQGLPQRFTNNTPSGRKEVLEQLSKSDYMIQDLTDRVNKRSDDIQNTIKKLTEDKQYLSAKVSYRQKEIDRAKEKLATLKDITDLKNRYDTLSHEITSLSNSITELEKGISNKQKQLTDISSNMISVRDEWLEKDKTIKDKYFLDKTQANNRMYAIKSDLTAAEIELNKLLSVTDVCPTCKQKIVNIIKPDPTCAINKVNDLKSQSNAIQEEIAKITETEHYEIADNEKRYKEVYDALNIEYNNIKKDITADVTQCNVLKGRLNKNTAEVNTLNLEISDYNLTVASLQETIKEGEEECTELNNEILYNKNETDNIIEHQKIIAKMQTALKRDFRGVLLTGVIQYINDVVRDYSKLIFNHNIIHFYLDGNNLQIALNEKCYEALSGGEKQKVDIIVQLALRKMLCAFLNFSCNIICFDEIFDNCDTDGCKAILNLITRELTDIDSIYIITHHSDLDIPADCFIKIKKDTNNFSYIER